MTEKLLKEYLKYTPEDGLFTWIRQSGTIKKGMIAGTLHPTGYIYIKLKGKKYKAHRLAFLYMNGVFPEKHVDHKNRIRTDNKWYNLREADDSFNSKNRRISSRNTSGSTGVRFFRNRWIAEITVDYKKIYLGSFVEFSEALNARRNAEVLYGFENE